MFNSKKNAIAIISLLYICSNPLTYACSEDQIEGICKMGVVNKGYYGYDFGRSDFMESRSGCSMTGQISKGGDHLEYNCVTDNSGNIQNIAINRLSGSDNSRANYHNGAAKGCSEDQIEGVCTTGVVNKGYYGYDFDRSDFMESRNGCSLSGQISKGGDRLEFNCLTDKAGNVQNISINRIGGSSNRGVEANSWGAPSEAQMACAVEGERYWRLARDTLIPLSSKSTGNGMFEVELSGGGYKGICTVDKSGRVFGIMNQ